MGQVGIQSALKSSMRPSLRAALESQLQECTNVIKNVFDEYLHRNITPEVYLDTIINLTIEDLEDVKKYINEECITINTFYKK